MSIAFDPKEVHEFVLIEDRQKPKAEQPTFLFHYPTVRERGEMARLFDTVSAIEAGRLNTAEELFKQVCDGLRVILVGWRNIRDRAGNLVAYDPSKLEEVITSNDMFDLANHLPREMDVSERDKKKYLWQLESNTEKSANDAKPDVQTSQVK